MKRHKCEVCGGPWPSFHICNPNPDRKVHGPRVRRSDAHRQALSEGSSLRWERYREENRARDEKIIETYKQGGVGQVALAEQFGISKSTINKVLKQASYDGLVQLRPPGTTLAKGAQ